MIMFQTFSTKQQHILNIIQYTLTQKYYNSKILSFHKFMSKISTIIEKKTIYCCFCDVGHVVLTKIIQTRRIVIIKYLFYVYITYN